MRVRVAPRSSKNEVRVEGDSVRVWVNASPTDGQANEAVVALLAQRLGIAKSRLSIVSGHSSRDKVFEIEGYTSEEAILRLQ